VICGLVTRSNWVTFKVVVYCKPSNVILPALCFYAIFAVIACPSVCLSQAGVVPKRLYVVSRRRRYRITQQLCSFLTQNVYTIIYEIPMESPPTGAQDACAYEKVVFYNRSKRLRLRRLTAENLCPSATVVRVPDSALAGEYAVSSTFNTDASQNLMITVTVQLISMSHRYWVRSFDEVQCCVDWNHRTTLQLI